MRTDVFGQETTIGSRTALKTWDALQCAFLAHGAETPKHLADTLVQDPSFVLGHAVKGLLSLLLGRRELVRSAAEACDVAHRLTPGQSITARERAYLAALDAWLAGDPQCAIAQMETVLAAHPGDALAVKISHAIRFILGDATGMRRSVEAVLPAYGRDHRGRGYVLGCHAFAQEETGDYARAERTGHRALEEAPDDAWGFHAVAHVHDMTGRARAGIAWLDARPEAWSHCSNFRYHLWWHRALMHLDLGETERVLAIYDAEVRKDRTDDYRDISNATSLLSRLELDGVPVGDRWDELADLAASRTEDGCLIFADLHYLLALVSDDRAEAVATLMGRLHEDARTGAGEAAARMARPGVPAAAGLEAFGAGDYRTAFLNLALARSAMPRAGGSHAQRDIFERITIDAGIRAGFLDQAETLLDDRQRLRNRTEDGYSHARRCLIAQGRRESGRPRIGSARLER